MNPGTDVNTLSLKEGDINIIQLEANNSQNETIVNFKIEGKDAIYFIIDENNMLQFKDETFADLLDNYTIEIIAIDPNNENITEINKITIITHRKDEPERNLFFQ